MNNANNDTRIGIVVLGLLCCLLFCISGYLQAIGKEPSAFMAVASVALGAIAGAIKPGGGHNGGDQTGTANHVSVSTPVNPGSPAPPTAGQR